MNVAIIQNAKPKSVEVGKKIIALLNDAGFTIDQDNPEVVISIGGDGTLLSAFHLYNHKLNQVRFIGVHTGHLGFYTDWRDFEVEELVRTLCKKEAESVSYPLLDVLVKYRNETPDKHFLALNESTIKRSNKTMVADIYIRDELFERFRGDGISISTPTGSTAYNKSVGGAILHPSIDAFQLAEIASLNNRVYRTIGSPIIVNKEEWVEVRLQHTTDYTVTVDQFNLPQDEIESIYYKIAEERIHFAAHRHVHFWHRVRDAFIGDLT